MNVLCLFAPLRPHLEPSHWAIQNWSFILLQIHRNKTSVLQQGRADSKDLPPAHGLLLLLPACDISLHQVELPALSAPKTLQALTHLLEERLAQPMEQVHIAMTLPDRKTLQRHVAAIDRGWFRFLCDQLKTIPHTYSQWQAIPDCLALDPTDTRTGLWVRYSLGVDTQLIAAPECTVLSVRENQHTGWGLRSMENCSLNWTDMSLSPTPETLPDAFLVPERLNGLTQAWDHHLNLFQFEFSIQKLFPEHHWLRYWQKPLGLAASVLCVHIAGQQLHWAALKTQEQQLEIQQERIVREAIPKIGTIIDPVLQLKRHLATLNPSNAKTPDSFLALSAALARANVSPPEHMEYHNGQLFIQWKTPPAIPPLMRQLAAQGLHLSQDGSNWRIQVRGS